MSETHSSANPLGQIPGSQLTPSASTLQRIESMRQVMSCAQAFVDPASLGAPIPNVRGVPQDVTPMVWRLMSGNMSPEAQQIEYTRRIDEAVRKGEDPSEVKYPVGTNVLTEQQARLIEANYAVTQTPNDPTGFSGTVLQPIPGARGLDGVSGPLLGFRDTEFRPNALGGNYDQDMAGADVHELVGNGAALGQIAQADAFIQQVVRPLLSDGEVIGGIASGSLSGHVSQGVQLLNQDIVNTSQPDANISFNGTNLPALNDPSGALTDSQIMRLVVDTYVAVRDNPALVSDWLPQYGADGDILAPNAQLLQSAVDAPSADPDDLMCSSVGYYDNPRVDVALLAVSAQYAQYGFRPGMFNSTDPQTSSTLVERPGNLSVISVAASGADVILVPSIGAGTSNVIYLPIEGQNALVFGGAYMDTGNNHSFYNFSRTVTLYLSVQELRAQSGQPLMTTGDFMTLVQLAGANSSPLVATSPNGEGATEHDSLSALLDNMRESLTPSGATTQPTLSDSGAYGNAGPGPSASWEAGLADLNRLIRNITSEGGQVSLINVATLSSEDRIALASQNSPEGEAVRLAMAQGSPMAVVAVDAQGNSLVPSHRGTDYIAVDESGQVDPAALDGLRAHNNDYELLMQAREDNNTSAADSYLDRLQERPYDREEPLADGSVQPSDTESGTEDSFNQPLPDIGTPPEPGDPIAVIADGSEGVMTDGGVVNSYGDSSTDAVVQPDPQDSATPGLSLGELAAQVPPGQIKGLLLSLANMGLTPEALGGVIIYTNPDGSRLITVDNGDGGWDTIGTMEEVLNSSEWTRLRLNGQEEQYLGPDGQVMSAEQYQGASLQTATQGLELFSSLAGLEGWSSMTPLQQASTLASLYNQIDNLGTAFNAGMVGNLPGNVGTLGGVLGLLNALESGNEQSTLTGGMQLASQGLNLYAGELTEQAFALMDQMLSSTVVDAATSAAFDAAAQGASAAAGTAQMLGEAIPYVNLIYSLYNVEDNPWGAVAAAAACFPPVGTFVAAIITVVQFMFPTDIDPSIGEAQVHIDANGAVVVDTTRDEEGGGGTAAQWAESLAHLAVGAGMSTPQTGATAQHLPSVGYYFDPDGVNLSNSAGHLTLRWTDANGQAHQRLYDSSGMRWDGNSVEGQSDIMRDYLLLCQSLEPNWPPVMYQEVAGGILRLDYGVATVLYATALGTYDGQAAHTQGGDEDTDGGEVLIDANSGQMVSLGGRTIENSTGQQTLQALGAQDLQTVPRIGASASGPQIPLGRDPIVFVPIQALPGGVSQTVTAGMVNSLTQANLFSDAQWAATAMALGLTGMAFASQAAAQGADQGTDVAPEDQARPAGDGTYDWGSLTVASEGTVNTTPARPGDWTDAQGQTVAAGGTVWPGAASEAQADGLADGVQPTEPVSDPVPPASGATTGDGARAALLPPGYGEHELGAAGAVLTAGNDLALDYPTAQADQLDGTEDQALHFSAQQLLANDSTPNPVPKGASGDYFNGLRVISVGEATHGQVGIQNGQLIFIPDENYNGTATFSYTVQDMYGMTHSGTASILVRSVNDAPEARGESATGNEDADLLFTATSLLRNDTDVDGDRLHISRVGEATGGTVLLQPDGSVRFVPTPNYNGPAGYAYWVSDGSVEVRADVRLNILQVNDMPVVQGELVDSDEDVVLDFPFAVLLANDSDVDTDPDLNQAGVQTLSISAVGNAQHGTVAIVDGQVRFTPDLNYFGPASFDYLVDDGAGGQVSTTVILNLAPVNDAPDVLGETDILAEDNAIIYTQAALLANDSDVDNVHAELSITQVGGAQNGSVELLPDGRIRFVPDADYFGPAQFDYLVDDGVGGQSLATVTLEVTPVNDDPRLQGEQASIDEDTVVTLLATDLLSNDHDVDNDHADLVLSEVGGATHGAVSMDAQGHITFTPTANYYGQASFTYTVIDGVGGSSTTTMVLDYQSVNDLPVVNDEVVSGKRGISYTFDDQALLANDTDVEHPGQLQIVAVGSAQNGSVTLLPNGDVHFVPAGGYDSWNPSVYGSFEYTVRDPDGGESVAVVVIDYSHVNLNPIAVNDSFHGYEDVRTEINVSQLLRNDSDPDASAWSSLQVVEVADAQHGSVSLSNGVVSFNPSRDYYGDASFNYRVSDGEGGSTWATAFIDIERENRAPVITGVDFFTGGDSTMYEAFFPHWDAGGNPTITGSHSQDDPHRVNGRIYAYDPDGDTLTFSISPLYQPEHGTAYINEHVSYGAPYGLDHVQLQGGANTVSINSYYGSDQTMNVPGVDPNTPNGGRHDYFVSDVRNTGSAYSEWQYISWKGDNYSGADSFVITVTDSRGLSTTSAPISVTHVPWSTGGGGCLPIVVDTGSDGIDLLRPDESGMFADINGDGWRDQIGWVASTDALLAYDMNDDALINQREEVSFVDYQPGARTDLEGLAAFDTNGDGVLSAADDEWARFGLLQDTNGNGVQDAGEWQRLQDLGVESVGLHSEGSAQLNNGNVVLGTTTVTYQDGSTQTAGDVVFAGDGVELPQWVQAELQSADHPAKEVPQVASINASSQAEDALLVSSGPDNSASVSETPVEAEPEIPAMTEPIETATESVPVPSIEQQANVFTQMQATQVEATPALGYVDAQSLSLSDEANTIIVLGDEPVLTSGTVSQSSAMAIPA